MESERKQRQRKREQIGHTIEEEMLPLEHTERRGNKTISDLKTTWFPLWMTVTRKEGHQIRHHQIQRLPLLISGQVNLLGIMAKYHMANYL